MFIGCCDLMLFDSVFQSDDKRLRTLLGCDLMLFDSVFQFASGFGCSADVVI